MEIKVSNPRQESLIGEKVSMFDKSTTD